MRSGRPERAGELRDAVAFLQPGDHPGPGGRGHPVLAARVERPISVKALHRALPNLEPEQIAEWLDAPRQGESGRAGRLPTVLETVLAEFPARRSRADPGGSGVGAGPGLGLIWCRCCPPG